MSIINRTSKSVRAIVITLVIAILSGVTLASKWDSFVGFAEGLGFVESSVVDSDQPDNPRSGRLPSSELLKEYLVRGNVAQPFDDRLSPAAVVFTETFDGSWTNPPSLLTAGLAWSGVGTGNNEWHRNDFTTGWSSTSGSYTPTGAAGTTNSARFHSYDASSGTTGDFITPNIDFSSFAGNKRLVFYYTNASGTDKLDISVSTDGGTTFGSSLMTLGVSVNNGATPAWNQYSVDLGTTTSSTVKIRFRATSDFGTTDIGLDQVRIDTNAPLTGTKTIPGDYATLTAAINDLNLNGVGAGGVAFNVAAGSTLTEDTPCITTSGTAANQIIFQKSGAGANPILRPTGGTGTADFGICLAGADYVTFDGIDVTINTGSAVEYGFLVRNLGQIDGATNNTIKNTAITLNRTNTSSVGILQTISSTGGGTTPTSLTGANSTNKFYNLTIQNVYNGVYLLGNSSFPDDGAEVGVTGAVTQNFIGAATANDIGNGTSQTWGIRATSQSNVKIFKNEIRNITHTSTSSAEGIWLDNSGSTTTSIGTAEIYSNQIHDINATSTSASTPVARGIRANLTGNAASASRIYNNFVYGLNSASVSTSRRTYGIHIQDAGSGVGATHNVDFNSVRLSPTNLSASNTCFEIGTTSGPVMRIRNNIFANFTGAQTGSNKHYTWITTSSSLTGNTGSVSNNNVLYISNTTNGFVGLTSATDRATLAYWQSATSQDGASKSSDPQFLSATNLHINPANPTEVESNGSYFSGAITWVGQDIDMDTRNASTPDIGADEGAFTSLDLSPPTITYTSLINTTSTANRNLSATITDATGVNTTAGTKPRIYYKKSTEANAIVGNTSADNGWKFTEATNASSPFSFVIDYSLLTSPAATNDTIQYFVVAQDTAATPNVGINSGTFAAAPVSVNLGAAQAPIGGTINSYLIAPAITGTKTVCASGCDYTTLTGATGIFNAINTSVATGNVNIEIGGDLIVGEDGSVALNPITEEPTGSNFTVKIYPTGSARLITSTTAPAGGFIRLNAADRITIDGSLGGTGTDRSLTVTEANTGTTSAVVWLQSNGTDGAQNNTIKNLNVVGNSNTTTLIGIGMGAVGTSSVSLSSLGNNNNNNTIQNNNISKTQYGIYSQGASAASKNTGNVITQNLINTASPNNVAIGGIITGFENNLQVTQNNVSGIALTSSPDVFGISLGIQAISTSTFTGNEVTNATVSRNMIGSIRNTGTFSACGICVAPATSGTNEISNNTLTGVSANGTSGDFSVGIFIGGGAGSTTRIYYNSVSMNSAIANTGSTDKSFALAIGGSDPTVDVRNNALYNTQNNGSGNDYAVVFGYSTFANLTSNNNDFFVTGSPAPASPFFTGGTGSISSPTNQATLANLQTATGKDANSISADPLFNNPASNLQPQIGSPLVGAGIPVSVLIDILGVTRSGSTPTIGAYENVIDTAGPVITYTPFLNTVSTGDRTLNTTITDSSGVPTSGVGLPVIYYRKNAGAWASTQCSFVSGSSYTCDIVAVAVGGVMTGDVIQYYVAAQDSLGNVSVNPSGGAGGFTTNPPAASTPPTTPNQYTIVGSASGSYNVGSAETITSLTNAGGVFEFINNSEVTGNITINITSDLTGELGTVALNEFASPFTILIKPSGAPRTITGTNTGALIRLNGADRVRFDGSTAASLFDNAVGGNPALRELTIQNTSTSTLAWVMSIASNGSNGAQNNTVQNINLLGQDPTTTLGVISLGGATPGNAATGFNNNNRVENCSLKRAIYGIYSSGINSANLNTGTVITQNETSAVTADRIRRIGILVFNDNGVQITENSLNGISTNESVDGVGIGVGTQSISDTNTTSGFVVNALVERNKINGVASLSTTGFSAVGIAVAGSLGGANTIRNNMITGVTAPATSPDIVAGIYVVGATGSSTRLYHNSVAMTGDRGAVATQMPSFGVAITGTDPTVEMKNNIFYSTQIASGGGANAKGYAIGMVTSTFANLDSDHNDFWSTASVTGEYRSGSLGAGSGTDYADVLAWNGATGDDANSQENDPAFINDTNDLHLNAATTPLLGDGVTGFATVDYDNDPRPASNPDIGADEIVQALGGSFPAGTFYNAFIANGDTLAGNVNVTNALQVLGISDTGSNTMTLGCNATVSGNSSSNYIVGNVRKDFCGTGTFTFPVGTTPDNALTGAQNGLPPAPEYSPFTANVTAIVTVPSSLTVSVTDAVFPNGMNPLQSASRYWNVTETGDLTADISFTWLAGDVTGTESGFNILRRDSNGVTAVFAGGSVNDATHTGTAPGVSNFSAWGAGLLAPTAANGFIEGRVSLADGRGIRNAMVIITGGGLAAPRYAQTGDFGNYRFEDLPVGQTYVVSVVSKRFVFANPTRTVTLDDNVTGFDFEAEGR